MAAVVTFQHNIIDATAMVGGFNQWQLIPNGPKVPANEKSGYITLPATTLNASMPDGNFHLYQPERSVNYNANEEIVLTGECDQPILSHDVRN